MSDEQQLDNSDFGRPGIEKAAGYAEMPSAAPAEEKAGDGPLGEDNSTFRHLSRQEMPEPEELFYQDKTGEKLPDNLTIERERGAADLSAVRRAKQAEIERAQNEELNQALDYLKQQVEQPQPNAQPEAHQPAGIDQPQPEELQYQQEQAAVAQADKVIDEALKDPWVRQRIETEFNGVKAQAAAEVQQHAQAYQQAAAQLALEARAVRDILFPRLAGMDAQQTEGALRMMPPQEAEQFRALDARLQNLTGAYRQQTQHQHQQLQTQLAQIQEQRARELEQFRLAEVKKFEARTAHENPETMKAIRSGAFEMFETHYGIPQARMRALASGQEKIDSTALLHSAEFQMLALDALKYRMSQAAIKNAAVRPAPQVQRPGVSEPLRGDDGEVSAAMARFSKNNSGRDGIRAAAELVAARRRARG